MADLGKLSTKQKADLGIICSGEPWKALVGSMLGWELVN